MMFKYKVKPSADFGVIFNQAVKLADIEGVNKIGSYFEMYPNNIPLLAFMTLWFKLMKLLGVVNYKISAVILNIIFIDTAVTFFYLSSKRIFKKNDSIILVMMMIMFLPFYTYVGMFYTDTMSMPFIAIIVYLCTFIGDECTGYKSSYRKIILLILLGVTACLGFKMKATVGILLIVFIIFEIIMKKNFKLKMINISFAYHITLIFLFIVGLIGIIKKRKHNTDFIVYVSILGLVIFLSIWETSPRYVLNFMPLILFQASPAVGELCDKIKFRK